MTTDGWETFNKLDTIFDGFLDIIGREFIDNENIKLYNITRINGKLLKKILNYNIKTNEWSIVYNSFVNTSIAYRDNFNSIDFVNDS